MDLADELINLFEEYRDSFGIGTDAALERSADFEDAFNGVVCRHRGHDMVPDHCGKPEHDFCARCHVRAEDMRDA